MGYEFQQAVRKCQGLTSTAKLVANALDDRMGRKKKCYPSYKTISEDAGVCRDSVRRAISRLETCGLLLVTRRPYDSSVYKWASAWADILPRLTINLGRPSVQTRLKFSTDWADGQPVTTKEPQKNHKEGAARPDEPSKSSPLKGGATTQKPGAGSTEAPPRQPIWTRQRSPPPKSDVVGYLVWELAVEAEKTLNQAYPPMWGRDKRLLKPRLKQLGREEIQRRWQNFLKECQTDDFQAKHNEIKDFCSNINGYAQEPAKAKGRVQRGNRDGRKVERGRLR